MAGILSLQQCAASACFLAGHASMLSRGGSKATESIRLSTILPLPFLGKVGAHAVSSRQRKGQRRFTEVLVSKWDDGAVESPEEAARRLQRAAKEAAEQGAAAAARNAARGAEEAKRKADAAAAAALGKAAETLKKMNAQQFGSGGTGPTPPGGQGESEAEEKAREERVAKQDAEARQRELEDFDRRLAERSGK